MNDEHDWVRDLLADSAEEPPMPAEVTARLDDVLAGLVAERSPDVVPLARRRRFAWQPALLAAAAVSVVAVGVGAMLEQTGSRQGDSEASGSTAMSVPEAAADAAGGAGSKAPDSGDCDTCSLAPGTVSEPGALDADRARGGGSTGASGGTSAPDTSDVYPALPQVDDFTPAVRDLAMRPADAPNSAHERATSFGCATPPLTGEARWILVSYRGVPASLVLEPAAGVSPGDAVIARLYSCAEADLIKTRLVSLNR